ncbi:histone deacetylase 2-like, partial [Trifolium medium]|nr:histone deacetylase 2-like [Trifolium medium]
MSVSLSTAGTLLSCVIEAMNLDYEARNYINQKVEVKSGTRTEEYLLKLDEALE